MSSWKVGFKYDILFKFILYDGESFDAMPNALGGVNVFTEAETDAEGPPI